MRIGVRSAGGRSLARLRAEVAGRPSERFHSPESDSALGVAPTRPPARDWQVRAE